MAGTGPTPGVRLKEVSLFIEVSVKRDLTVTQTKCGFLFQTLVIKLIS